MPILTRTTRYTSKTDIAAVIIQATNLVAKSQELDNAIWLLAAGLASVTPNATVAPDGTTTAERYVELNGSAADKSVVQASVPIVSGANYAWSMHVKADTRSQSNMTFLNQDLAGGIFSGIFDLSSQTWVTSSGTFGAGATLIARAFQNLGSGWFRISVVGSLTTTSGRVSCDMASGGNINYVGDGTSGLYVWGAQLESGTSASNYVATL